MQRSTHKRNNKDEFVQHLEKIIVGAMKQVKQAHGQVLPNSVAKRVASQLWAESLPNAHADQGAWVKSIRAMLGLTQSQFASLIGTNQVTVARWETGFAKPSQAYRRILQSHAQNLPSSAA